MNILPLRLCQACRITRSIYLLSFYLIPILFIVSCASSEDLPARVVEEYYQALTRQDLNTMVSLVCSEWEEQARNEYNSFSAVTTQLQEISCETVTLDQTKALVKCNGKIVANYGNEILEINLAKLTFQLVQQSGNWRFCGYP
ncbi:MAG: hypothetical protein N3D16_00970 [Anaerolineales bacterium]|nr:hypothetical protein [Anaerolineales bacterium]